MDDNRLYFELLGRDSSDPHESEGARENTVVRPAFVEEDERHEPELRRTNDSPNKEGVRQSVK